MKIGRLAAAESEAGILIAGLARNKVIDLAILSMIYQCEGSKDNRSLRFTNSDPDLVRLFLVTLRSGFDIDEKRLRMRVHMHDYHNEQDILDFWSGVAHIPREQFYKSFRKSSDHRYKKYGYKGCVHVSYYDSKISRAVSAFAKKLINLYI